MKKENININAGFKIEGKVKYELTDVRNGNKKVVRENNILLDDFLDKWFVEDIGFLDDLTFDKCYLGDSNLAPARGQVGLQGNQLDVSSSLEKIKDNLNILENNYESIFDVDKHSGNIYSLDFSPDGKKIVSGSRDETAKILDTSTGDLLLEFTEHIDYIRDVSFSPDGTKVASGGDDDTVKVWDASTGDIITNFTGHTNSVRSVSFSPDGTKVASGSLDDTVKIWDTSTGNLLLEFTGHTDFVRTVSFSPDGTKVASAGDGGIVKVWDASTGDLLLEFTGHSSYITSVSFSPDGTKVASAGDDETVKVWDASTGDIITNFTDYLSTINSVDFSPDGEKVISCSSDETVKIIDSSTGDLLLNFKENSYFSLACSFSPNGDKIASSEADNNINVSLVNFNLNNKAEFSKKFRFPAGSGTSYLIKEIALRAGYYNSEYYVARQVPSSAIDKKDYHQLDITWEINITSTNIYYLTTISDGQRDNTSIDIEFEIENTALACLSKYNDKSLDSFFGITGTPKIALGTSNNKKYPNGTEKAKFKISLDGIDIEGGYISPYEVTPESYTNGSYSRTFRVGLESDQGNHTNGIGEMVLKDTNDNYIGRIIFTPPLDKVNTYRFYIDITFQLIPS